MLVDNPYQKYAKEYDNWFKENRWVYDAELRAVRSLIEPVSKQCIEVGVGTGRFAVPLGIKIGVEPSENMGLIAQRRGIKVFGGVSEELPFKNSAFDLVLMVTVISFVNDIYRTFNESFRVLSYGGSIIIGMIDRNSPLGQVYLNRKHDSLFYKQAIFYSVDEVVEIMRLTGFDDFKFKQTIFKDLSKITRNEMVKPDYGEGLFAVIHARKK